MFCVLKTTDAASVYPSLRDDEGACSDCIPRGIVQHVGESGKVHLNQLQEKPNPPTFSLN
jgi:hypothetical protein